MTRGARFSRCGRYRYVLTRRWGAGEALAFVMLNPSTADAVVDDPTIRRCMSFARREGRAGAVIVNLYAYRATKPADLFRAADPLGPGGAKALRDLARAHRVIVCAWGALPTQGARARAARIAAQLRRTGAALYCLGRTADGQPRHPLYARADRALEPFA